MKALCIIDVQNAMVQGDNPVYRSNEVLQNIKKLIVKARKKSIPIIYVQHNEKGSEFQRGLDSWKIVDMIKPQKDDSIIHKTYSDSFKETNLKQVLDQLNINELIIVGMQTDYCVNATSLRANELDYDVTIVSDAHSTWDSNKLSAAEIIQLHHDKWIKNMTLMNEKDVEF